MAYVHQWLPTRQEYNRSKKEEWVRKNSDFKKSFHDRLRELGFGSYEEYLRSDHWDKVREAYWSHPKTFKSCCCCRGKAWQLHHTRYDILGNELQFLINLRAICGDCHKELHSISEKYPHYTLLKCERKTRSRRKRGATHHN